MPGTHSNQYIVMAIGQSSESSVSTYNELVFFPFHFACK